MNKTLASEARQAHSRRTAPSRWALRTSPTNDRPEVLDGLPLQVIVRRLVKAPVAEQRDATDVRDEEQLPVPSHILDPRGVSLKIKAAQLEKEIRAIGR
eukprot:CAMPEP_0198574536 /NCGR_PEP_ID=MMETSP1462-20131121/114813_1 /TAXON_ID=1333877 /ORGANISM="Brandtodinium nutriculum, Strain RCC3387" /LENGTH=98 /DNA_ID=CAMNT_0044305755 /DNA_START=99 /DNA_END=392 /DNA_ORIENTATION=-